MHGQSLAPTQAVLSSSLSDNVAISKVETKHQGGISTICKSSDQTFYQDQHNEGQNWISVEIIILIPALM